MLKTNFNNFPKGKPFTELLGDLLGSGIFNVDGKIWSTQRKLASHGFTTKSLKEFVVTALEEEVNTRLLPTLEKAMKSNEVIDLQDLLRRFAFNIVCKFSLGIDPSAGNSNDTTSMQLIHPISKAFDTASMISARRGAAPIFLVWKIKRFLNISSERELKKEIDHIHEAVMEIIKNKKKAIKGENNASDLLAQLILAGHDEDYIRDMVISFIMAGKDTTSAAMTWLFWLLSRNPHIKDDLLKEVTRVVSMRNSNDEKPFLDYESLKEMEFTKACLCEAMRLYPPVAWDSKHAHVDDILPDGTSIQAGDRVTYFPYGMGRMESLWGKDRLEFKPDRWFIEPDKEDGELKNMCPYKFPVFQAGPRVCLGKDMAFLQMKYVVASVLNRFEIKPVCSDQPVFVPLLTAHMAGGLKVRVQPRTRTGNRKVC
ncbi:Cytochrome p450 [Thalictrum thalictroides]|uniref:Cytochrome p450 n=1 Tax=Thalictrum thalictroides TaxID=46969 RepID=A0A7J6VTP3_THATH|nr:Cytochrome p450 [Thalictrum thalictroides]